jgi:collagenase-like PrtC family protease
MKLSVACNFDDDLLSGLDGYPVYEIYGKLTSDYFGGGRPSFYLPEVDRSKLTAYVQKTHEAGISFNYLLNASAMGNLEFTRQGQVEMEKLLAWLSEIGVDSVTVANVFFLRLIKKRFPNFRVRVSAHRYTDTPRKVRFWVDNGADCIVVSEVNIYREFAVLEALKEAAGDVDLQLIVNNWCRQDCAIAGTHAVNLSNGSQSKSKGFPLDYSSLVCNELRLKEPVNYLRANWIRPDDLPHYEALGYDNFKIVERNTPTPILLQRVKAYAERHYDGNLLDLVQNYAYPEWAFGDKAKDAYSLRRMVKYFVKPRAINLLKFPKVVRFGKAGSVLYPLRGENPVQIDNRQLDGFIERFKKHSCQDLDCEACRYCHDWADKVVKIDDSWKAQMRGIYRDLLDEIDSGTFWESHITTVKKAANRVLGREG